MACSHRLCPSNSTIWREWWVFNSNCRAFFCIISLQVSKIPLQGELAHRLIKHLYKMTNKQNAAKQIRKWVHWIEMAQQALYHRKLWEKQHVPWPVARAHPFESMDGNTTVNTTADDSDLHYFVSPSQNYKIDIYQLLKTHSGDLAYKVSI